MTAHPSFLWVVPQRTSGVVELKMVPIVGNQKAHQLAGLLRKAVPCTTPSRQSGLRGRGQTPSTAAPLATRPSPVASLTMTLATASGFSAPRSVLAASPVSFPIAVFTRPGQTAQTLIPVAESSCASASVKPIIPNLLAQ